MISIIIFLLRVQDENNSCLTREGIEPSSLDYESNNLPIVYLVWVMILTSKYIHIRIAIPRQQNVSIN